MEKRTRWRVWLLAMSPAALLCALWIGFAVTDKPAPPRNKEPRAIASAAEVSVSAILATAPIAQTAQEPVADRFAAALPAASASAAPTPASSIEPEPIPELEAFFRPPLGANDWSEDQKQQYLAQCFRDLDARQRELESAIQRAERSGDTLTAGRKRATLAELRRGRGKIETALRPSDKVPR